MDKSRSIDELLEEVNERYMQAVERYFLDIDAYINTLFREEPAGITEKLRAIEGMNGLLWDMMYNHSIDDLDWKGGFTPDYDWVTFDLDRINFGVNYHSTRKYKEYNSIEEFENDLIVLEKYGIITDLDINSDYLRFNIRDYNSTALQEFTEYYQALS